jgi:hypothetical protein
VFCNIVYQSYSLFLWQVLFCPHNPVIYIFFSFFNYIILLFMNVKKGDKLN